MEQKRHRINRTSHDMAARFSDSSASGGLALDIDYKTPGFYRDDGVHLSPVGISMYIDGVRDKLSSPL